MAKKHLTKRGSKDIDEEITAAAQIALTEEAFYMILAKCKYRKDCSRPNKCPYLFTDERGFDQCIFSLCPENWLKYIELLEEDKKNE